MNIVVCVLFNFQSSILHVTFFIFPFGRAKKEKGIQWVKFSVRIHMRISPGLEFLNTSRHLMN